MIGVGLDSAEAGYPPELFERAFAQAADRACTAVAHAGEEGPPAYVWSALDRLGVERIDHGIRSLEDPSLVARLREEQVPLTVCPLSNLALRGVDRTRRTHPLVRMLGRRPRWPRSTPTTPPTSAAYLHDNMAAVTRALGLTTAQRRPAGRDSFRARPTSRPPAELAAPTAASLTGIDCRTGRPRVPARG